MGQSLAWAGREPQASSRGWEKVGAVSPGLFYHSWRGPSSCRKPWAHTGGEP